MTGQLPSHLRISGLIRTVQNRGGHAAVLARGDRDSGAILLILAERGTARFAVERQPDFNDGYRWGQVGPDGDVQALAAYFNRRRTADTDLWIVELDVDSVDALMESLREEA